ncbi:MAG: FAD-dependent oxidoreductase [Firmicutes bacterium]|nr:FAD-dependent oxidoreductase [Bacillota bacterium]
MVNRLTHPSPVRNPAGGNSDPLITSEKNSPGGNGDPLPPEVDLAVIGAGPSGLTAAIEAAGHGVGVVVVDENERPGGQLFKQIHKFFGSALHGAGKRGMDIGRSLLAVATDRGVTVRLGTVAWGFFPEKTLGLAAGERSFLLRARCILLASGAVENALAFPGWTLPGVMGAGAAQTLANIHRVLPGREALVVGAGNVGLIVAFQLLQAGCAVKAVVEAAPRIGGYAVHAAKLARCGVPILTSTTIKQALGRERVGGAELVSVDEDRRLIPGTERRLEADLICLAVGLSPLAELAWMAGCRFDYFPELGGHVPLHSTDMETTIPGIYVAGDAAGVEEVNTAMEQGRLVGTAVAEVLGHLDPVEAGDRKETIRRRMDALRTGPFGAARRAARERLITGFPGRKATGNHRQAEEGVES